MIYCCSVFPKIAKRFEWMMDPGTYAVHWPYIGKNFAADRINFCPHCGKYIRGIVITKEKFDKLK
jgi:hypothetical protein